jgi:hypothetical protein
VFQASSCHVALTLIVTALLAIICSLVYISRRKRRTSDAAAEPAGAGASRSPIVAPTGNINASSYRRGPRRTGRPGSGSSIHAHIPLDRLRGRPFRVHSPPPPPPPYVPGIVLPAYSVQQQIPATVGTTTESNTAQTTALPTESGPREEVAVGSEDSEEAECRLELNLHAPNSSSTTIRTSVPGSQGSIDTRSSAPIVTPHPNTSGHN